MAQTIETLDPTLESVLHPTDFSEGSKVAFHHALKAALLAKSKLTLLNVSPDGSSEFSDFPGVRETLERWGLLQKGSSKAAVGELGIDVRKVVAQESDPVDAVLRYLKKHPADLIVLATHQREGRARSQEAHRLRRRGREALRQPGSRVPRQAHGGGEGLLGQGIQGLRADITSRPPCWPPPRA